MNQRAEETPVDVLTELRALRDEVRALRAKITPPAALTLTIAETMARLGCGRGRVFELLAQGAIKRGARAGRGTRVTVASIDAYETSAGPTLPEGPQQRPSAPLARFDATTEQERLRSIRERNGNVISASKQDASRTRRSHNRLKSL